MAKSQKRSKLDNMDTLTFLEKVLRIARETGITRADVTAVLKASNREDLQAISEGTAIYVQGMYTILPKYKKPHEFYNPKKDEKVMLPAKYVLTIRPHKKLKDALDILIKTKGD